MKFSIALAAVLTTGFVATSTEPAVSAVVYCTYIGYPTNCVVKPGVVLRPRAVVRAVTPGLGAPGPGIRPGTPMNRGGPVHRVGKR